MRFLLWHQSFKSWQMNERDAMSRIVQVPDHAVVVVLTKREGEKLLELSQANLLLSHTITGKIRSAVELAS